MYKDQKDKNKNFSFIERFFNFINNIKKDWKNVLFKYAIFIGIFTFLLIIDQVTKNFIFGEDQSIASFEKDKRTYDFVIIGFTPLAHHGVTIFTNKELSKAGFMMIHIISIILLLVLLAIVLFVNDPLVIIIIAGIAAGDIGNFIDRMRFNNTVKDIIYSPFFNKWVGKDTGVFNFADAYIVSGIIILIIYLFYRQIGSSFKEQIENENIEFELFVDPKVLDELEKEKNKKGFEKIF